MKEEAGETVELTPKEHSERLGVSVAFLLSDAFLEYALKAMRGFDVDTLPEEHRAGFDVENPSFHYLKHVLISMGKDLTCPRDGKPGCSIVDALDKQGRAGPANVFLSWVWGYPIKTLLETLRNWIEQTGEDPNTTFIW